MMLFTCCTEINMLVDFQANSDFDHVNNSIVILVTLGEGGRHFIM